MLKTLRFVSHVIWAVCMVVLGTAAGALYGWHQHGWAGAIALGFVGLCVGAFLAISPAILLQMLT